MTTKHVLLCVFYLDLLQSVDGGSYDTVTAGTSAQGHAGVCVCVNGRGCDDDDDDDDDGSTTSLPSSNQYGACSDCL